MIGRNHSRRSFLTGLIPIAIASSIPGSLKAISAVPTYAPQAIPKSPGMSLDSLVNVGDDDGAVMEALTYLLWRTPVLKTVVDVAYPPPSPPPDDSGSVIRSNMQRVTIFRSPTCCEFSEQARGVRGYNVSYNVRPFDVQQPTDATSVEVLNRLCVLFVCQYLQNSGDGAFNGAFNIPYLASSLKSLVRTTAGVQVSTTVYDFLLSQTVVGDPSNHVVFSEYLRDPQYWGSQLAALAVSQPFIDVTTIQDPLAARRKLDLMLYKIKRMGTTQDSVLKRWMAPDLKGTQFALAATDPWPVNYFEKLETGGTPPMKPILDRALKQQTSANVQHCIYSSYDPSPNCNQTKNVSIRSEVVWRFLKTHAAPAGLMANPQYPKGLDPNDRV
jgi:hypothetical protein